MKMRSEIVSSSEFTNFKEEYLRKYRRSTRVVVFGFLMFTLWTLVEASLLCLNAVCVLHEERFLAKIGWGVQSTTDFGQPTAKSQALNLIRSIRTVAKIPLIFLNIIAIIFKLILG